MVEGAHCRRSCDIISAPVVSGFFNIIRGEEAFRPPECPRIPARRAITIKTAKALGLTIPPSLLLRADQVIE